MKTMLILHLIHVLLALKPLSAQDIAGSADHPLFSRIPGFYITDYSVEDYASEDFVDEKGIDVKIEGKKTYIRYECDCQDAPLRIIRNYSNAASKIGGNHFEYSDNSTYINIRNGAGETWVNVWASPEVYILTIVEKGEVNQEILANDILKELNTTGKAILYINFDSGKSSIKQESMPIVEQIAEMMNQAPSLKLSIEGHTDSDGSNETNQKLSEDRAKAVMEAIVKRGIDTLRLSSVGFGESKPIADNENEAGKAKNRRVELVKK